MYLLPHMSRKTLIRALVQQTLEFEGTPDVDEAPIAAIYQRPHKCNPHDYEVEIKDESKFNSIFKIAHQKCTRSRIV